MRPCCAPLSSVVCEPLAPGVWAPAWAWVGAGVDLGRDPHRAEESASETSPTVEPGPGHHRRGLLRVLRGRGAPVETPGETSTGGASSTRPPGVTASGGGVPFRDPAAPSPSLVRRGEVWSYQAGPEGLTKERRQACRAAVPTVRWRIEGGGLPLRDESSRRARRVGRGGRRTAAKSGPRTKKGKEEEGGRRSTLKEILGSTFSRSISRDRPRIRTETAIEGYTGPRSGKERDKRIDVLLLTQLKFYTYGSSGL